MLAIVLTLCMILSMMPTVAFADSNDFHDIGGHWAEEVIEKWADRDIVSGMGNNQFNPNGEMTRAQAAAVFANFFGLSKKADVSNFTDVEDAWYTDAIAMCVEAGIMSGVGNNKMDPHGTLTREQMFTMFANGLGLKPEPASEKDFVDDHKTSSWAQGYVNALVNRGFVSGMAGNKLAPEANINRASVMALIDSTVAEYVTESGSTVEAPKNGGLVIVVADDVTITGELSGTVLAVGGNTKITVEKATADAEVVVASGSENVTVAGEFAGTVTVAAKDTTVKVENATEDAKVVVVAENATVEGEIKGTVEVAEGATGTTVAAEASKVEVTGESATVEVTGKVETVEVKETASNATVEVAKDATVENVKTEAAGTTVAGEGKVEKVEAAENATGTTVNTNGSTVENNSKEDVIVGTGTIESGSTGTSAGENSEPTEGTTTPSTGGSTGGSSGGSSKPSHSHTWGAWTPNGNGTHSRDYNCGHSNLQTAACDGTPCSVCGDETVYVAEGNGIKYKNLNDAFAAGGEITLITGVEVSGAVIVPEGKTVTLNLNGKTVSGSTLKTEQGVIVNNGTITISGDGTVTSNLDNGASAVRNNGTMVLDGGTYLGAPIVSGSWPSYVINNYGALTVNDITVKGYHGAIASCGEGSVATLDSVDAEVGYQTATGITSHVLYTADGGTIVVNSGEYKNTATDANAVGGSLICALGKVTVKDGVFTGGCGFSGDIAISGGTFDKDPSAYLVDGCVATAAENSTWVVEKIFEGGKGTVDDPFIISSMDDIAKIGQISKYAYYKVDDGVTSLDGSDWTSVNLIGSFDGNNVVIENLDAALFNKVGARNDETNTYTVKNITINANIVSAGTGVALIRTAPSKLIVENVDVHGFIEGSTGTASYIGFGPANNSDKAWDKVPFDVQFIDCVSDATLLGNGDMVVGFVKHPYSDPTNTVLHFEDSAFVGKMYGVKSMNNLKYFIGNGNAYDAEVVYSEDFITGLGYHPVGTLYDALSQKETEIKIGNYPGAAGKADYYIKENSRTLITQTVGSVEEMTTGSAFTVNKAATAVSALVTLEIAPNDTEDKGSYLGTYMSEVIDLTEVEGEIFETNEIRYFEITINNDEAEAGLTGNVYNVVNSFYGNTHNGATVRITQHDEEGIAVSIITFKIAEPN